MTATAEKRSQWRAVDPAFSDDEMERYKQRFEILAQNRRWELLRELVEELSLAADRQPETIERDTPLAMIEGLPLRTINCLDDRGIRTVGDLAKAISNPEFRVAGIGDLGMKQLASVAAQVG